MLDRNYEIPPLADSLSSLKCDIELPPSWQEMFQQAETLRGEGSDRRRFARSCFRTTGAMICLKGLTDLRRPNEWHKIFVREVSPSGLSLLHSEQLYPGERMCILVIDGQQYVAEVRRCRRIREKCFEIGVRFADR